MIKVSCKTTIFCLSRTNYSVIVGVTRFDILNFFVPGKERKGKERRRSLEMVNIFPSHAMLSPLVQEVIHLTCFM